MSSLVKQLTLNINSTIIDAMNQMESIKFQIIFVTDSERILKGLITNGDLRRYMIAGGKATDSVSLCMNKTFRSVRTDASREEILRLLDLGFHVIPMVDETGCLVDYVTSEYNLTSPEAPILTRARAPVRITFSGGGSDVTYYFIDRPGVILSSTIALYSHATLIPRKDKSINIYSEDLGTQEKYQSIMDLLQSDTKSLLSSVAAVLTPSYGFDLYVRSDFPLGSGLGGSSAVATAVVAAFNEIRLDRWSTYEIAELAFQAERLCFGIAGGWQDQYASAFGGFNLIELGSTKNLVHAIRIDSAIINELQECLILCNSLIKHDSGDLHVKQRSAFFEEHMVRQTEDMVTLCRRMYSHLLRGELLDFAKSLDAAWKIKRDLSPAISSNSLDNIYDAAIDAGALGGKLMGAGGGGYFMFFVQPQFRQSVSRALRELGCEVSSFSFESKGVVSWRTRVH